MLKYVSKYLTVVVDFNLELKGKRGPSETEESRPTVLWFFIKKKDGFVKISDDEYRKRLGYKEHTRSPLKKAERTRLAFDLVVENRKFEIELYWKRATYFWAFIASAFVAYAALARSDNFLELPTFIVICVGFTLSCAWYYTNLGSKVWQRHWEKHLDLLENHFSGPLYKTVFKTRTYSVSKINVIVSFAFRLAWIGLGLDYLHQSKLLNFHLKPSLFEWPIFIAILITLTVWCSMKWGYGRGRFRERNVEVFERL